MKRIVDLLLGAAALLLLSPIVLGVALAVRIFLGRPVFFRQVRPGLNGEPFTMYKFRTLRPIDPHSDEGGSDADRMTPLGSWLRSTSLDELPELFNVLRGEMSLVGPRPLLLDYLPLYSEEQARRHEVRPGITGWAQINGRNALSWEEKFRLDTWYVEHHSFCLDIKIMAITLKKVLFREGISQQGHPTSERFRGSGA